jgi:3-deoxy-manno-octulosonate cytidylyltransferase (CMP-KDO synthetase)
MLNDVLIVIPARMGSSRFPGKPKAPIAGRSLLERVWRIGASVPGADCFVGSPDQELVAYVEAFGGQAVHTPESAGQTGSDCAAIAAEHLAAQGKEYGIVLNLQGDAPLVPPWVAQAVVETMRAEPEAPICTPIYHLKGEHLAHFLEKKKAGSLTGTTCVFDTRGYAMYFSKGIIPNLRTPGAEPPIYRHIGLYGYRREALKKYASLSPSLFEKTEGLEQLRALENGMPIRAVQVDLRGRTLASVDHPDDVARVEEIIAREGELLDAVKRPS